VLLASTSYTLSATFGWPASLWKKPWQNEGFYLILTGALVMGVLPFFCSMAFCSAGADDALVGSGPVRVELPPRSMA
jgi:hypothetical protein